MNLLQTVSLEDYRQRHAQYKTDPDLQQVHARFPFVVTWDDHELTNDAWHGGAQNHSEDEGSWN
ncbi:MAG: alkaline phosphatase D family protein, partial [Pseudomonadota bacterium]